MNELIGAYPNGLGHRKRSKTSKAAAISSEEISGAQCQAIMNNWDCERGMTGDEVAVLLGCQIGTASARMIQLERANFCKKTDMTRLTRSNRKAVVYHRPEDIKRLGIYLSVGYAVPPEGWLELYEKSAYTYRGLAEESNLTESTIRNYITGKQTPTRKEKVKEMEQIVNFMQDKDKAIPYHPAYGYATKEQIEQLNKLKLGADRDAILRQIDKQTKLKGKLHNGR